MTEPSEDNNSETILNDKTKIEMPPPVSTKVVKRLIPRGAGKHPCTACNLSFAQPIRLKYHIRSHHYNLKSKLPMFLKKDVNEVWFERVSNTDNVAEITKVADYKLLVRKTDFNEPFNEDSGEDVDVTDLYPFEYKREKVECNECNILITRKDYKKHFKNNH
ncbi:uncharacterized protein LOC119838527 [Zerene cesonia]|uniref:uncharacterized protein LOC119838527 n=1 Tax=Zerene cesonia TaxID=33412 RepID=UPI0018E585F1|nr:uncharacterized protein LOC119838527 [Zerene cesonia]